jgi:hypothetical protein
MRYMPALPILTPAVRLVIVARQFRSHDAVYRDIGAPLSFKTFERDAGGAWNERVTEFEGNKSRVALVPRQPLARSTETFFGALFLGSDEGIPITALPAPTVARAFSGKILLPTASTRKSTITPQRRMVRYAALLGARSAVCMAADSQFRNAGGALSSPFKVYMAFASNAAARAYLAAIAVRDTSSLVHYALISKASSCCRFYLDLEWFAALNPHLEPQAALRRLMALVQRVFTERVLPHLGADVAALAAAGLVWRAYDASKGDKVSFHLIVENLFFSNNFDAMARFFNLCMAEITDDERRFLTIQHRKKDGSIEMRYIVDPKVSALAPHRDALSHTSRIGVYAISQLSNALLQQDWQRTPHHAVRDRGRRISPPTVGRAHARADCAQHCAARRVHARHRRRVLVGYNYDSASAVPRRGRRHRRRGRSQSQS